MRKALIGVMIFFVFFGAVEPLLAQDVAAPQAPLVMRREPPMRNVFLNVLWGSMAGGITYAGFRMLDDTKEKSERYSFTYITEQFVYGATAGGLVGLGVGVYLSISGIGFDANRSRIAHQMPYVPGLPDERQNGYGHFAKGRSMPIYGIDIPF